MNNPPLSPGLITNFIDLEEIRFEHQLFRKTVNDNIEIIYKKLNININNNEFIEDKFNNIINKLDELKNKIMGDKHKPDPLILLPLDSSSSQEILSSNTSSPKSLEQSSELLSPTLSPKSTKKIKVKSPRTPRLISTHNSRSPRTPKTPRFKKLPNPSGFIIDTLKKKVNEYKEVRIIIDQIFVKLLPHVLEKDINSKIKIELIDHKVNQIFDILMKVHSMITSNPSNTNIDNEIERIKNTSKEKDDEIIKLNKKIDEFMNIILGKLENFKLESIVKEIINNESFN